MSHQHLRILMICPQFRPIAGGYEVAAERLSVAMAERRHAVTVVTERRERAWPKCEAQNGVRIRRLWCLYSPRMHTVTSLLAFVRFLLTRGRDHQVWHVHQYGVPAVAAAALGKLLHRPVVLKLTNTRDQGLEQTVAALPLARFARVLLRRVEAVVALTRETQSEALKFGIPSWRVHRLGNGVDTSIFRPRSNEERERIKSELGIDAKGVVMFVGRLSAEKNPDGLLTAWQKARPRMPEGWQLVLVGDGPMRAGLEGFVKNEHLVTDVIFAGQQGNVEAWLGAADVFVLASHNEGLANTMLEAMAVGLPVVSTRVSGSAEAVGETGAGLVIDIDRMDQLAEALVRLAADASLRRKMGRAGRSVVEGRYSIGRVAEAHLALYRQLTSSSPAHGRTA